MELIAKKCVPCREGAPTVPPEEEPTLLRQIPEWSILQEEDVRMLEREYLFPDFISGVEFVNRVSALAEEENHHPEIRIHWGRVRMRWWTFKIRGLHENDFIMARKTDAAYAVD